MIVSAFRMRNTSAGMDTEIENEKKSPRSLRDLAQMAGTSTATVSRVLANRGTVRQHLREKVLSLVRETGYVPNASASALARRRFGPQGLRHRNLAVALLAATDTAFGRLWDETYDGILDAANELHLGVSLCLVRPDEMHNGSVPASLMRIPCDGILASHPQGYALPAFNTVAPTVLIGGTWMRDPRFPSVEQDDEAGILALLAYLRGLGHERFEFVPATLAHQAYARRAEAFRAEAARRNLSATVAEPVGDRMEAYAAEFAKRPPNARPTALMVSSDGPAVSLLHALLKAGVKTPREVSVVGFDGRPWGKDSVPPLTSWHVDWRQMGKRAVRSLVDLVSGEPPPSRILIGGNLLERDSAAPPPG